MEMKKLNNKQKLLRNAIKNLGNKYFILKSIVKNRYLFINIKYKIFLMLMNKIKINPISIIISTCLISLNKKKFNKFSFYSRHIFSNKVVNGEIFGFIKCFW